MSAVMRVSSVVLAIVALASLAAGAEHYMALFLDTTACQFVRKDGVTHVRVLSTDGTQQISHEADCQNPFRGSETLDDFISDVSLYTKYVCVYNGNEYVAYVKLETCVEGQFPPDSVYHVYTVEDDNIIDTQYNSSTCTEGPGESALRLVYKNATATAYTNVIEKTFYAVGATTETITDAPPITPEPQDDDILAPILLATGAIATFALIYFTISKFQN